MESETLTKFGNSEFSDKLTNYYNLDMIISVGYRVKSKNGIKLRKWATKFLKYYILKKYAINKKRLDYLEKTIKLIIYKHNVLYTYYLVIQNKICDLYLYSSKNSLLTNKNLYFGYESLVDCYLLKI